ncbi:DUF7519 family protein [Haloarcula litorea]|uniref:DUF7519 family protein n=1 Tax=Haloarcula litorea TaxID=3032579 RepID=UPI0023E7AC4A|nr:hypothetical protein [Halomicroarcula sp. GDY20]
MSRLRLVGVAAVAAGLLGALAVLPTLGGPVALLGAVVVGTGVARTERRLVTAGAAVAGAGVLAAGAVGTTTLSLLVATAGVVLAWDFGQYAVTLDEGTNADARTRSAELVRVAGGTFVAALTVAVVALGALVVPVPTVDRLTLLLLFVGVVLTVYGVR